MERVFIILTILVCVVPLFSQTTYTVGISDIPNEFDFSNINQAINTSASGDTIVVYPGIYRHTQSINFSGKNVFVTSRYKYTGNRNDIYNTELDGSLIQNDSVVKFTNGESRNAVLNGFTIKNGTQGGVNIYVASPTISNCVIRNNQTSGAGAGIFISVQYGGTVARPLLSGNVIKENVTSASSGGGIYLNLNNMQNQLPIFDTINKNSVFFNTATGANGVPNAIAGGNDINSFNGYEYLSVIVDTFTVATDDPYYILMNGGYYFSCDHWKINQINQSVYVSPLGSDNNNGLSVETPFKTIAFAMKQIKSNPVSRNTIYLSPGYYRESEGQVYPFLIKSDVILQGAGADVTIIDLEMRSGAIYSTAGGQNFKISGIHFINNRLPYNAAINVRSAPIVLTGLQNSEISDCSFSNNVFGIQTDPTSTVSSSQSATFRNLSFTNNFTSGLDLCLSVATLENIKFLHNGWWVSTPATYYTLTPIRLRYNLSGRSNYTFSNLLIAGTWDNLGVLTSPDFSVYEGSRATAMIIDLNIDVKINNATIVNNDLIGYDKEQWEGFDEYFSVIRIDNGSHVDLYNSIVYYNNPPRILGSANVKHTDLEGGVESLDLPSYWGEGSIDETPFFDWGYLGVEEWPYQLGASSPCIDTGTTLIPNYSWLAGDLLENTRIVGDTVDMGAYEFHGSSDFYVDFEGSPRTGVVPLTVQFIDTSVGINATSWQWDFNNDGIFDSTEQNPVHTYYTVGQTSVRLVVNNGQGFCLKNEYINSRPATVTVGTLQGLVTCAENPLSDVLVTVTGVSISGTTNTWGVYSITNIPAGSYSITATKTGYDTYTQENIIINSDETTTHNIVMAQSDSENDTILFPVETYLKGNYPNPFNPTTTILYDIAREGKVKIEIFNVKGQRVKSLVDGVREAGSHIVVWDGHDDIGQVMSSGIYFYRMTTDEYRNVRKMLLLK